MHRLPRLPYPSFVGRLGGWPTYWFDLLFGRKEVSVPHICPRTVRAYVGGDEAAGGTGFGFDLDCASEPDRGAKAARLPDFSRYA